MGQRLFENTDLAGAHCSWAYRLLPPPSISCPVRRTQTWTYFSLGPPTPQLSQESHPKDDRKSPYNLYAIIRLRGQQENCGPPFPPNTLHPTYIHGVCSPQGTLQEPSLSPPPSTKHGTPSKQAAGATAWLTGTPHVSYCKDFEIQTMCKLETNKCSQLF